MLKVARKLTKEEVEHILAPLKGLPFSVGGGAAMMMHGLPRETGDVDVIVPDEKTMMEAVHRLGGTPTPLGNEVMTGYSIEIPVEGDEPFEIDVIMPHVNGQAAPWVSEAIYKKLLPKEWLLLTKMQDPREKSFNDTLSIYRNMQLEEKKRARDLVKQHMPNMMDDFRSLKDMAKLMPVPAAPAQQAPSPKLVAFVRSIMRTSENKTAMQWGGWGGSNIRQPVDKDNIAGLEDVLEFAKMNGIKVTPQEKGGFLLEKGKKKYRARGRDSMITTITHMSKESEPIEPSVPYESLVPGIDVRLPRKRR